MLHFDISEVSEVVWHNKTTLMLCFMHSQESDVVLSVN